VLLCRSTRRIIGEMIFDSINGISLTEYVRK
jgi:hypothetical protein